jgi:DNA topoisomerase-3
MLPLADAAVCRAESDWLVGINGTRAMTAFNSKSGGFQLTTVGRVQTPTLAIITEREEKIRAFKPRNYWELIGTFGAKAGEYTGRWFDEGFKKPENDEGARAERIWDEDKARTIALKCTGQPGIVTEEAKPSTQSPPLLYDLTTLQREANGRFGLSARTTLSLAQALYEKHKVLTYPRTDARALPEDYIGTVNDTLKALGETNAYGTVARKVLKEKWVKPNKRIFDNSKISDHFAIIPTLQAPKNLNELEQKLYDFVVKRFISVFYPAAEFMVTTRITRVAGEPFKTDGKVLVNPGWLTVYGKEAQDDDASLTPVTAGEKVTTDKVDVVAQVTRPPARLNEGTLLSAMEGAGKTIDDDELREAMREKGLGTPATRAQTIEGLIYERYIYREGKELVPTAKAFSLMTLLHGLGVPELFSPELTAEWEFKLAQMEKGKLARADFMQEIVAMTQHIVGQAKGYESDTIPGDFATLTMPCPKCGGEVREQYKKFLCVNGDFGFWKIMGGRQLEPAEADTLIAHREVGPLEGFRSRLGRAFSAKLKMNEDNEVEFDFGPRPGDDDAEAPDFSGQESLGPCPKDAGRVFETETSYVCEHAVGPNRTCDFRSGRMILQRTIEREQMQKLLANGKTDLLQFVSARTRRPFSAYLARQPDGKVGFEFEPKGEGKGRGRPQRAAALRVLGVHPRDKVAVEVYSGRYGPYIKHGDTNATLPDKDKVDALTLEEALVILSEKTGTPIAGKTRKAVKRAPRTATEAAPPYVAKKRTTKAAPAPRAAAQTAKRPAVKTTRTAKTAVKRTAVATETVVKAPAAKRARTAAKRAVPRSKS